MTIESLSPLIDGLNCSKALSWMYHESFVLERTASSFFMSFDCKESWISMHFNCRVKVFKYELMCPMAGPYMTNWVLLGAEDDGNWVILDEKRSSHSLAQHSGEPVLFTCLGDRWIREVKLVQTDYNNRQTHIMALSFFDVVGITE